MDVSIPAPEAGQWIATGAFDNPVCVVAVQEALGREPEVTVYTLRGGHRSVPLGLIADWAPAEPPYTVPAKVADSGSMQVALFHHMGVDKWGNQDMFGFDD